MVCEVTSIYIISYLRDYSKSVTTSSLDWQGLSVEGSQPRCSTIANSLDIFIEASSVEKYRTI